MCTVIPIVMDLVGRGTPAIASISNLYCNGAQRPNFGDKLLYLPYIKNSTVIRNLGHQCSYKEFYFDSKV